MWLRKNIKKLTGSSKGFSSVIGTIFMVLLVMTSITGVFVWTLYQNTLYNSAVRAQNQQELDVRNENVVASNGNYSVSGGKVSVMATLTNAGPLTTQIVNLWVFDTSKQTYGFNNSVANKPWANLTWTTLKAGQVLKFTSNNATKVTVPSAVLGDSFSIWFMTARGNTVPLTQAAPVQTVKWANVTQGIGALMMDFQDFTYYKVKQSGQSWYLNFSTKTNAYNVKTSDAPIGFRVKLTNLDLQGRNITLNLNSELFSIFPTNTGAYWSNTWYIITVNPTTGLIQAQFSKETLNYTVPTFVYFASWGPGSFSTVPGNKMNTGTGAVNLALTGTLGGSPFGQNIPFVSIYVS
jgi:hypothetical protein